MNDPEFLTFFDILASADTPTPVLLTKSSDLIQILLALEHNPQNLPKNQLNSPFGSKISEDLHYTLNKVIKGCTSSDLKVQFQFSLVLKGLLSRFEEIKSENYLDVVLKECNIKNSIKKSEIPHYLIAKFLCIFALILSRKIENEQLYSYCFEILVNDMQSFPWIEDFAIKIIETSFYDIYKENKGKNLSEIRSKIKAIASKFKPILKSENSSHLKLLITISKASKEFLNTTDFPFKKQLDNNLLDYNKLLKVLIKSTDKFPKEPLFIQGVVEYMEDYCEIQGKAKEIWEKFWEFFVSEFANTKENSTNFDFKKCFLVLCLFKRFLKQKDIKITNLRNILIPDLITLWLKNLNVQNENLKKISKKIEKNLLLIIKNAEKTEENRQIILELVFLMKEKPFYKFSGSNQFATVFFQEVLLGDYIEKYWKFLKKKLLSSEEVNMKLYIMGEIQHFCEFKINDFSENKVIEIISQIFKEISDEKIKKILKKSDEEKEEWEVNQEVKKYKEKFFDYFYSILNGVIKKSSIKFKEKKNLIWKGLTDENKSYLILVMEKCVNQEENSNEKQKRLEFLKKFQTISSDLQQSLNSISSLPKGSSKISIKRLLSFFSLLISVGLMSFQWPDDSFETLDELFQVSDEIFIEKGSKSQKKRKLNNGTERKLTEPKSIQVLMDIMVSLLAKSPNFLRDIVRRCFVEFVDEIDSTVLQNLTNVITRNNEEYNKDMLDDEES